MDSRVYEQPGLTADDLALLRNVEAGLPLTADVSRADILLCILMPHGEALVAFHALPNSISSLYRRDATGRLFKAEERPLLLQALRNGSGGRRQHEVLDAGAPIIQDVFPIHNGSKVVGAMLVETNMIAHERQRRRNRHFRRAVVWLQEMCACGELASAEGLGGFNLYDGIYLVDEYRTIIYMSGIAANLFRSIGIIPEVRAQPLSVLEDDDIQLVELAFSSQRCQEYRHESPDGRIWLRTAVPLRAPSFRWRNNWRSLPWNWAIGSGRFNLAPSEVLVLMHNATEAVQKQRELNVKAAIIQEVHHRVKNNLQNIAAILRIQARRVSSDEARQALNDAVNRVLSMAVIHEFLSHDEHRPINVKDVCQRIATQLTQVSGSPDQEIAIQVQGTNIRLPASQATPVALVINELLLNAVEHGLKGRPRGRIGITLDDLGDAVRIVIEDDGNGLPPDFDPAQQSASLGLHIVHTLVTDDLKGTLSMQSVVPEPDTSDASVHATGTQAIVTFPKRSVRVG